MKVTTRDLFNYENMALKYQSFLKFINLQDGDLSPISIYYDAVFTAKRDGTLEGEQVKHTRFQDEVDCGD